MQASRAASTRIGRPRRDARPAPPPRRPPAPWAAAARRAARARRRPGWRRPGRRGRASGRSRARPTAPARCVRGARPAPCSCAAQRRTWCVCAARSGTRSAAREALQPVERLAVQRQRARGEAALDPQVLEVARDVGVARGRRARASSRRRRSRCRQQPRQRGARDLADAGQELGAHVGGVARRVGRGEHEQAEGAALALVAQRDQRDRERLRRRRRATAPPRSRS